MLFCYLERQHAAILFWSLTVMPNKNKKVRAGCTGIESKKTPKTNVQVDSYYSWNPSWNFSLCDLEHEKWSIIQSKFPSDILPKLISFERRKWSDIINDKKHNHWIECSKFIKEAKERLIELNYNYDSLFSLRLTGRLRLFGIIEYGVFYVIWYDIDHEICPAPKKHT